MQIDQTYICQKNLSPLSNFGVVSGETFDYPRHIYWRTLINTYLILITLSRLCSRQPLQGITCSDTIVSMIPQGPTVSENRPWIPWDLKVSHWPLGSIEPPSVTRIPLAPKSPEMSQQPFGFRKPQIVKMASMVPWCPVLSQKSPWFHGVRMAPPSHTVTVLPLIPWGPAVLQWPQWLQWSPVRLSTTAWTEAVVRWRLVSSPRQPLTEWEDTVWKWTKGRVI